MKLTKTLRVLAIAAAVGTSALAFGVNARAATEGDTATFVRVYDGQEAGGPLSCEVGPAWLCETSVPLDASGLDCIQTVYVNVVGKNVGVPLTGCSAQLMIRGEPVADDWQGTCVGTSPCEMPLGHGLFTFVPVVGGPWNSATADISATCSSGGVGHATVTASGVVGSSVFSMTGTIDWIGGCAQPTTLTWSGQVTIA